jgi:PAS domain S-box-containing protein
LYYCVSILLAIGAIKVQDTFLTGVERTFDDDEVIVSKTDLKGRITYANNVFLRIADLTEKEALGQPHSLIRHPGMPRCVFKLLWDTLQNGKEIFAYVINRSMNGDHYWVHAHVTPSFDSNRHIVGYHSNRRVADRQIVTAEIIPLYKKLLEEEQSHSNRKTGMQAGTKMVGDLMASLGIEYDEFVCTLGHG